MKIFYTNKFKEVLTKPYKQIEGNIINITNNTFTILTNKGTIYTFNKPNNFNNTINDNIKWDDNWYGKWDDKGVISWKQEKQKL